MRKARRERHPSGARSPAQRQRAGEYDRCFSDGVEADAEQRILQPHHENVVQEIDAVSVVRQTIEQTVARPHQPQAHREQGQGARGAGDGKGERRSQPIGERASIPVRQRQRRQPAPDRHARDGDREPCLPVARQRTVMAQHAALNTVTADRKCREEIDDVVKWSAEQQRKRTEGRPVPRSEQHRQRNVGQHR